MYFISFFTILLCLFPELFSFVTFGLCFFSIALIFLFLVLGYPLYFSLQALILVFVFTVLHSVFQLICLGEHFLLNIFSFAHTRVCWEKNTPPWARVQCSGLPLLSTSFSLNFSVNLNPTSWLEQQARKEASGKPMSPPPSIGLTGVCYHVQVFMGTGKLSLGPHGYTVL